MTGTYAVCLWTIFCLCVPCYVLATPVPESDLKNPEDPHIPGGLIPANVSDEYVKKAAAFAVKRISDGENSLYRLVLVKILSAEKQIVSGVVYYLQLEVATSNCRKGKDDAILNCTVKEGSINQLCNAQVWDKPWLNNTELTERSCSPILPRQRRAEDPLIPGGPIPANVSDEYVKKAAAFAVKRISDGENSLNRLVLVKILSAETQVVSGVVFYLQLEVAASNCRKGEDDAILNCTVKEGSINLLCNAQVWDRPWLNNTELTERSCSPILPRQRRAAGIPGGLSDADVNDDYIKKIVRFAFQQVDKRSNSVYKQKLVRIVSAQSQVIAGVLYHIKIEVGDSNCEKEGNKADSECALREGSSNQTCTVKVLDRPWLQMREVTELKCTA